MPRSSDSSYLKCSSGVLKSLMRLANSLRKWPLACSKASSVMSRVVVEDGVEHGCVAVIAGNFDFVDGDEACARIFQASADEFGKLAHDLFFDTVLAGVAALGFSHGFP